MANSIERASVFQSALDNQFAQQAVTGWMDENAGQVQYAGGKEIKVPSVVLQGLGTYDRTNGAPGSVISLSYQTLPMTMDRGRALEIDEMDVEETKGAAAMAALAATFQEQFVAPEIDAYRLSKAVQLAGAERQRTYTPAAASVLQTLNDDIMTVIDKVGSGAQLIIHISNAAYGILINSDKLVKQLDVINFQRGEISQRVRAIDGIPLINTRNLLMKSAYTFNDGTSGGQETGGFAATAEAKQINWIIFARRAPIAVSKQDASRLFSPAEWQKARCWHYDYRRYHDLWITQNKLDGVYANIGA